jgi:peptidoglycan L-alanyl-D-glutamate endopeptidase CwlK
MTDSRDLADLHPIVRDMAIELLAEAAAAGIPLTVTFTRRSLETQAALYSQGRTAPGPIVTRAMPGHSYHNFGMALDVVPTELLSLPNWGDHSAHQSRANALWNAVGALGKAIGLRWGGDFVHIRDRPHFEWSGGLSLAQLRRGARPLSYRAQQQGEA